MFSLALILLFAGGCKVTKNLQPDQYLLIKNRIRVEDKRILAEELEPYLQQKPNSKLLGLFRTNIALYNWGTKGDDSKFKKWLRTKAGSEPVILDTTLNSVSRKQMVMYLANRGFFKSAVSDTVILKKKKAIVEYRARPAPPYSIGRFLYAVSDTQVARYIYRDSSKCLIRRGDRFDAYVLDDERTRITGNLLNHGFFKFSNIYIKYRVDTNFMQRRCDITLEIINNVAPSFDHIAAFRQIPHKRYSINNIYVYPEFDHLITFTGPYDTLRLKVEHRKHDTADLTYFFLHQGSIRVRPQIIAQSIFVAPGSVYNLKDVNQTYSQLNSLQVFKYINIQFRDTPETEPVTNSGKDVVNCHIELSRAPAQSFSVTTDGTNSGGAFGVQGNLGYANRNIFRGGQLFRMNLSGSFQMQAQDASSGSAFFNVFEFGINGGITFPQFLIPIRPDRFSKSFKPKTTISVGYNYQHQQHYDRHISNATFGYSWDQNDRIRHVFNPIEISLVKVYTDAYFDSVMATEQDNRLKNQYTDHLVAGLRYTFTFSNQQVSKIKDFWYIRSNIETGGNLLYAINSAANTPRPDGRAYQVAGLPYAQYVRPDIDLRYYNVYPNKFSLVYRVYAGIGIPYGNVNVLPFEKTFFSGGANGMRGWKMYTLGPGTYAASSDETTFNQIGDMQLEANVEYRFPVYEWIRGGLFLDAGNIWLLQESADLPGGKFKWPDFFRQFGVDAGLGIRLDFDFFIFRLDPAIRLYDPSYPVDNRWYFNKMQLKDVVWNFGIGYPF